MRTAEFFGGVISVKMVFYNYTFTFCVMYLHLTVYLHGSVIIVDSGFFSYKLRSMHDMVK